MTHLGKKCQGKIFVEFVIQSHLGTGSNLQDLGSVNGKWVQK